MGFQDRNYYGDHGKDPWSTNPDAWKGSAGGSRRSIITIIIIVNVVIFLADAFTSIPADRLAEYELIVSSVPAEEKSKIPKPARWLSSTLALNVDVVQKPWNVWQLLTHGFAHASIDSKSSFFHVGFNMVTLFFLGRPVEQKYGRDEFLRFYLTAIVVAGVGWVAAQWIAGVTTNSTVVGASGAVSAVIALFIMNYWDETIYLFGAFGMKAWVLGVILIVYDLFRAFGTDSAVAWEAHLVGMAFGAAYFQFKWNFSWMKFGWLTNAVSSKPKLRVHDPDAKDEALKEQADKVLEKIAREGENSLTSKERRILEKYSKSLRNKNRS